MGALGDNPKLQPRVLIPSLIFLGVLFGALWARRPVATDTGASVVTPLSDVGKFSGQTMGTTWNATVVGVRDPQRAADAVQTALDGVDQAMSTYKADSELSLLNGHGAGVPFGASAELMAVLGVAAEVHAATGGAFDVTVGPLVDAWGFGPGEPAGAPEPEALAAARARVDGAGLVLAAGARSVTKTQPDLHADLSAVAKGFGVDQAIAALVRLGYTDALVEVGGELRIVGEYQPGKPWQAGVERPDGSGVVAQVVPMVGPDQAAMATSGDYRNARVVDGRQISHTIDPRTGQPVDHDLASVSVLAPDCARADAWATALTVLGPAEGMALAQERNLPARFVIRSGEGFVTQATGAWPGSAGPQRDDKEIPSTEP